LIGGSLLPLGGQNLIEACAMGKPVLVGAHTFNFGEATERAIAAGAAIRIDEKDLAEKLTALIASPTQQAEMGRSGLNFSKGASGSTKRLMQLIDEHISKN
jgi:3-deoxy-D-manno-octulosonic-acid transferase